MTGGACGGQRRLQQRTKRVMLEDQEERQIGMQSIRNDRGERATKRQRSVVGGTQLKEEQERF